MNSLESRLYFYIIKISLLEIVHYSIIILLSFTLKETMESGKNVSLTRPSEQIILVGRIDI